MSTINPNKDISVKDYTSDCDCPDTGHVPDCRHHSNNCQIGEYSNNYDKAMYNSADFNNIYLGKWNPPYVSHNDAYFPNREQMIARILDTVRNNGVAAGAIDLWVDHLCSVYTADPMPAYESLGWSSDDALEWARTVMDFMKKYLYSDKFIDASGSCNFTQLLQLGARMEFIYGEITATIEWIPTKYRPNSPLQTAFNFIDPGQIRTPVELRDKVTDDYLELRVDDGFVRDKFGGEHGAYIYPDLKKSSMYMDSEGDAKLVKNKGTNDTSHRDLLVHIFRKDSPNQARGVSRFAPILEGIKMHKQLQREILLSAQFRNKVLGVWKSSKNRQSISDGIGLNQARSQGPSMGGTGARPEFNRNGVCIDDKGFTNLSPEGKNMAKRVAHHDFMDTAKTMGGVKMLYAWPDEEMEMFQPNNQSIATTSLNKEMSHDHAAGTSIPTNMLHRDYSNGNYSGLRSGRLDFFQAIRSAKPRIDELANCILRHAIDEAIAKDLVKFPINVRRLIKRKGLTNHEYYVQNMNAIMETTWLGPPEKLIDPNKEILSYYNAERYGYMNAGEIIGRLHGQQYPQFLENRKLHCKQKIAAQIECDEFEIRRRLELNQKLVDEGLIQSEGNTEEDKELLNQDPSEPVEIKIDKNDESTLQNVVQSTEGIPLDTTDFVLEREDQLVPNRGRPQDIASKKLAATMPKNYQIDSANHIGFQTMNQFSDVQGAERAAAEEELIDRLSDAVMEKIEAMLANNQQGNIIKDDEDDREYEGKEE